MIADPVIEELYMLGFEPHWVDHAIKINKGDGHRALEWLLSPSYKQAVYARTAEKLKAWRKEEKGDEKDIGGDSSQDEDCTDSDHVDEKRPRIASGASGSYLSQQPQIKLHLTSSGTLPKTRRMKSTREREGIVGKMSALQEKTKSDMKISVGLAVLVFSQSMQDWTPGKIEEVKDDLVLIGYGENQKWLPLMSKVWRPIFIETDEDEKTMLQNLLSNPLLLPKTPVRRYVHDPKDYEVKFRKGNPGFDVVTDSTGMNAYVGRIRSKSTRQNVKVGSQLAVIQQQSVLNMKTKDILLILSKCSIGQPLTIIFRSVDTPIFYGIYPRKNETDYEVIFTESFLGLELQKGSADGVNAVVKRLHSDHAKSAVSVNSFITSIDHIWVYKEKYVNIKDVLKNALSFAPTAITFRAPIPKYGKNVYGVLMIRVVAALNLISTANYAQVQVGSTKLNTRSLRKKQNVEWQEKLAFKKFRPAVGRTAIIKVCLTRTLLADYVVGACEFLLPTRFSSMNRDTLELTDKRGNLRGLVLVHSVVIPKPD